MQGGVFKKVGLILLVIHLVVLAIFIIDDIRVVGSDKAKAGNLIWKLMKSGHLKLDEDIGQMSVEKDISIDEVDKINSAFYANHIASILVYLVSAGLTGLALLGVLKENRCLILFGAIMAIIAIFQAIHIIYKHSSEWELKLSIVELGLGPFYVVVGVLLLFLYGAETAVLFMLRNSVGAGGMGGAGMA